MHLLRHIVDGMKEFGPVYGTWMYGYERFNSWLHRRVMNRRWPEATLMETYRVNHFTHIFKTRLLGNIIGDKYVLLYIFEPSV